MFSMFWWLMQTSATTAIMAVMVASLCLLLRRRPAVQNMLWLVILVKFVTPPVIDWPWSIVEFGQMETADAPSVPSRTAYSSASGPASALPFDLATSAEVVEAKSVSLSLASDSLVGLEADPTLHSGRHLNWLPVFWQVESGQVESGQLEAWQHETRLVGTLLFGVWTVGAVIVVFRQVQAVRRAHRIVRKAHPAPKQLVGDVGSVAASLRVTPLPVFVAHGIASPFLFCWGRLRLLWPEGLCHDSTAHRGVIAHELAHVKRRDYLVAYLELTASCIWWWNPVFWLVRRRLRESAEFACDALALKTMPEHRREYAELFLSLCHGPSKGSLAPQVLSMGASGHRAAEKRLSMIFSDDVSGKKSWSGVVAALALAAFALPTWTLGMTVAEDLSTSPTSPTAVASLDQDSDDDGLSDFQERHKYLTDPHRKDSDADGVFDGDWHERREFAYTVRSIVRVMQPCGKRALNDDFQDTRILDETSEYVELEVVHYPLATSGDAIEQNANWQQDYADMTEFLRPRINTNWDEKMRSDLLEELAAAGIHVDKLTDKQVVEKVGGWFINAYQGLPMFNALHVHYPQGKIAVIPGREARIELQEDGWNLQEQFEKELLGRSMFYHKTRGSCTSSAMGLTTALRAIGIPTRMVLAIPIVDGSDDDQIAELKHLSHHQVRETALQGISALGNSFASHTYNEVFVGRRWHRLNYNRLGQPILDKHMFGLVTHVHTFNDLSEWGLETTWGDWYATSGRNRVFAHSNPYATLAVTDRFGEHAEVTNPAHEESTRLERFTISSAYWFHGPDRPGWIPANSLANDASGHILVHVDEPFDIDEFARFYSEVDKRFTLQADGVPEIPLRAERGYWNNEFYLRIAPADWEKMQPAVIYRLATANPRHWKVMSGVSLVRDQESRSPSKRGRLTITKAYWFLSKDRPSEIRAESVARDGSGHLLVHVADDLSPDEIQRRYRLVDKTFVLRADGHPDVPLRAERGNWSREFYLRIAAEDYSKMASNLPFTLVAFNGNQNASWHVEPGVTITKADVPPSDPDGESTSSSESPLPGNLPDRLTLTKAYWVDSSDAPSWVRGLRSNSKIAHPSWLLVQVKPPIDGAKLTAFTKVADRSFLLKAEGRPDIRVDAGIGCIASGENCAIVLHLSSQVLEQLSEDVSFRLVPRNEFGRAWDVEAGLTVRR